MLLFMCRLPRSACLGEVHEARGVVLLGRSPVQRAAHQLVLAEIGGRARVRAEKKEGERRRTPSQREGGREEESETARRRQRLQRKRQRQRSSIFSGRSSPIFSSSGSRIKHNSSSQPQICIYCYRCTTNSSTAHAYAVPTPGASVRLR